MPLQIHKPRVALAIKEAIHVAKPHSGPDDLPELIEKQHALSQKLHHLVHLLKHQQASLDKYNDDRLKAIQQFVDMSVGTPISEIISDRVNEDEEVDTVKTVYKKLFIQTGAAQGVLLNDVIAKITQWEKNISHRIQESSKYCDGLRRDLEHYEKKVDGIHAKIESSEEKEKKVSSSMYEKRERNDEKLSKARSEYEKNIQDLLGFAKEVTEHAWKDLVPIIVRLLNWEMSNAKEQAEITNKLSSVVETLNEIADKSGFNAEEDRIDALKASPSEDLVDPEEVSRPGTPVKETEGRNPLTPDTVGSPESLELSGSDGEDVPVEPES